MAPVAPGAGWVWHHRVVGLALLCWVDAFCFRHGRGVGLPLVFWCLKHSGDAEFLRCAFCAGWRLPFRHRREVGPLPVIRGLPSGVARWPTFCEPVGGTGVSVVVRGCSGGSN